MHSQYLFFEKIAPGLSQKFIKSALLVGHMTKHVVVRYGDMFMLAMCYWTTGHLHRLHMMSH